MESIFKGEKKMKKIVALFLSTVMILLCFSGCSSTSAEMTEENITATTDVVFTALKEFNTDDLETYVSSSTLSFIMSYAKKQEQFADLGKAMFENLTYEITSIDTANQTITLSVSNKDLAQVAGDFANDLMSNYSTFSLLNNLSSDTWLDSNLAILTEDIASAPMMSQPAEITLTIQQNEENLVFQFDETAENSVSGGALGAIKNAIGI